MTLSAPELNAALTGVSSDIAARVRNIVKSPDFSGRLDGLSSDAAASLLPFAASFSVHPISGFAVGAIAVGATGHLYLGTNLEFSGLPLNATLHAEQSAVLNAWMHDETEITALYVSETPCGHCRQFLRELSNVKNLRIHVGEQVCSGDELLPHAFGEIPTPGHGLLDSQPTEFKAKNTPATTAQQCAIHAAQQSYTPYSSSPEGFVIESLNGRRYCGRAAESAAFNPSVPGALAALNQLNLSSNRAEGIHSATEVMQGSAMNNPLPLARELIRSISDVEIEVIRMDHP